MNLACMNDQMVLKSMEVSDRQTKEDESFGESFEIQNNADDRMNVALKVLAKQTSSITVRIDPFYT